MCETVQYSNSTLFYVYCTIFTTPGLYLVPYAGSFSLEHVSHALEELISGRAALDFTQLQLLFVETSGAGC